MKKELKEVLLFSVILLIIDQIIKIYINSSMILNQTIILIKNFLNITYVHNTGAAFSLFKDKTWLLIIIGIIVLVGFSIYLYKLKDINDFDKYIYSLLYGGILGNLLDRVIYGYVIDYISLNIFGYYFPIFNFADMCIVIGVLLMFISTFKGDLWKK